MARNAFNLIVSAVVATAATIIAGPAGFAAAASIFGAVFSISNIALSLINPSTPSSDLDDIRANKSAYGEFIHITYNTVRLGGHLVWASAVRAKERGKGGFEYGQDLRFVICESPRTVHGDAPAFVTVKRIWLNKQLVFTIDEDEDLSSIIDIISTSVDYPIYGAGGLLGAAIGIVTKRSPLTQSGPSSLQVIRIWYGEPTQMPWDVQVAALGQDNTPAYRGVISISIANVPLHLYGNAIPQLEVEVDVRTVGATPDFIVYDPAWEEGRPIVEHTENTGYRDVLQILASPTYHPDTMLLLMGDNTDEAGSPLALGRRDAATGEWEKTSSGTDKVAILNWDGTSTGDDFIWLSYVPQIVWPPSSTKIYSARYKASGSAGGTAADFWFVEWSADYPFTFQQKSATPADKGETEVWAPQFIVSNRDGSLIAALCGGSAVAPNIHLKFAFWHPGSNTVAYYRSDEAPFSGLWTEGSGSPVQHLPDGILFDKNDRLWVWTAANSESVSGPEATPLHLDEFSVSVGGATISLTHLNRYTLNNQTGGFNTWGYFINGATYNESTDTIVFHWYCQLPSWTVFDHDPAPDFTPYSALESSNTPTQFRITKFDLATRAKKLSAADSVRLSDGAGTYLDNFGGGGIGRGSQLNERASGISDLVGTIMNFDGDRTAGLWTGQDWTVYVWDPKTAVQSFSGHVGFVLVDTDTGAGTLYQPRVWDDFIDPADSESRGVELFGGSVYEPETQCFWAARYGQTQEATDASEEVFLNVDQGFGRYFINPGSVPQPWNLQQINEDLTDRTGAIDIDSDTDYSALAVIEPLGFDVDERRPARDAIDKLRTAYLYDIVDEDHLLKAKLREASGDYFGRLYPGSDHEAEATIDETEVCVVEGKRRFVFQDSNEQELPRWLDLKYYDINAYHQIGTEPARIGGGSPNDRNAVTISVSVVMDSDEAATTANRILRSAHAEKEPVSFALSQKYLRLGPADVVVLTRDDDNFEVKITEGFIGANWALPFTSVSHDSGIYSMTAKGKVVDPLFVPSRYAGSQGSGTSGTGAGPAIAIVPEPRMVVIDTALVDEVDDTIGYFITAFPLLHKHDGGKWSGADAEQSAASTGGFVNKGRVLQGPIAGETTAALADFAQWASWDRTSVLKVQITNGKPISVTETRLWMEPELNLALVGDELIQFATAIDRGSGVFWLTDLLRGRLGTEWAVDGHASGEAFLVYDKSQFLPVTYNSFLIGKTRYWRAKNDWQGVYSDVVTTGQATRRLKPYAPYFIRGHYDSGDNLSITFLQRQRVRGDALQEPPEFEVEEDFECDVMNGAAVVRTITTTASAGGSVITTGANRNVYYSAADQLSDWGALQPSYEIELYKLNAVVGRGYPGRATV